MRKAMHEVRGGAGKPVAANGRKSRDEKLLEGLDALLKSLRADEPGEPKPPNNEQPASGDQDQQSALKGRKKQRRQEKRQETGLLNALERLVTRAKREPEGVLQRLEGFLEAAKRGQIGRPVTADRSAKETKTKEEPASKPRPKAQDRKTYAEAARKGTSKDQEHTETQPRKVTPTMRLWEGAWPKDAVISHFRLKNALEEEEHIRARVAMVRPDAVCELQTLARAHGYKDTKMALVLVDVAKAPADHKVAWLQLHLKDKAPQLRKVALVPLVTELPDIPSIVVKTTKPVNALEAITVRCTIRECCLEDPSRWTKLRSKPEPHVLQTICPEGKGLIRTYGWSDLRDVSGRVEGVTGFLRVTKTLAEEAVSTISGKGGVFVDNLAQQGVRLPVAWITRLHDESAEEYFRRAMGEAGQKGLAFRRGGGSYLGVRGGTVTDKDTWNRLSQWRLHGVPAGWSGDQLCLWLQDNGWKESEVVMPPRQRLGWVVRAKPPSVGFCHGIELDDHKIVTLSRYLYQHARPMSEIIQNPGSGFLPARIKNGQSTSGDSDWRTG